MPAKKLPAKKKKPEGRYFGFLLDPRTEASMDELEPYLPPLTDRAGIIRLAIDELLKAKKAGK